jgi:hypothetical protein
MRFPPRSVHTTDRFPSLCLRAGIVCRGREDGAAAPQRCSGNRGRAEAAARGRMSANLARDIREGRVRFVMSIYTADRALTKRSKRRDRFEHSRRSLPLAEKSCST